ncbi:hypothetical protein WKI32_08650 [Vibrio alginolyticus]
MSGWLSGDSNSPSSIKNSLVLQEAFRGINCNEIGTEILNKIKSLEFLIDGCKPEIVGQHYDYNFNLYLRNFGWHSLVRINICWNQTSIDYDGEDVFYDVESDGPVNVEHHVYDYIRDEFSQFFDELIDALPNLEDTAFA